MVAKVTQVSLPTDMVERLQAAAKSMGMDLATYLAFLEQCRANRLDPKMQDAAKFMLSNHAESLRKLAQ